MTLSKGPVGHGCVCFNERWFHSIRWNYRKLIDITKEDIFPLPRIDDKLVVLPGSEWF